eukprot:scaffold83726_cov29-Tisochrysis_lutea.AAC.1
MSAKSKPPNPPRPPRPPRPPKPPRPPMPPCIPVRPPRLRPVPMLPKRSPIGALRAHAVARSWLTVEAEAHVAGHTARSIAKVKEARRDAASSVPSSAWWWHAVEARLAVAVVDLALATVGKDLIRFCHLLELGLRRFLLGLPLGGEAVRVPLQRLLPVRLLDLVLGGCALDAEQGVEVAVGHAELLV